MHLPSPVTWSSEARLASYISGNVLNGLSEKAGMKIIQTPKTKKKKLPQAILLSIFFILIAVVFILRERDLRIMESFETN